MCGIAALYGSDDAERGVRMLSRLTHRGPDDIGYLRVPGPAWLGHTRLSIVDLSGGRQPLAADGAAVVANGEIYNHEHIRVQLGCDCFATRSDSEAALRVLLRDGPGGLHGLHGMWALCAVTPSTFVAARDPIGIKPLYWARREGVVAFASEMRAFDDDWRSEVEIFPPGHYWTPATGLVRFADAVADVLGAAVPVLRDDAGRDELTGATRTVLIDSIERHLMADVDVGVFLSGGLDSSLVAAVAARRLAVDDRTLQTFAVGTEGSSDLIAARVVAEHLGTDHHEAVFDAEQAYAALDDIIRSVESFDPRLIHSSVPNWFLAALAAEHVKVVLTGEGADELFAGYAYYHEDHADPVALQAELERTVGELHGLNLQRCDRVTMAHGLEARVPFLDRDVVGFALGLPAAAKTVGPDGLEKRLLREAFDGWLPEQILWRPKEEFGQGSGAADVLAARVEKTVSLDELDESRDLVDPPLRTGEELAYYRRYVTALPGLRPERTLTRFARA